MCDFKALSLILCSVSFGLSQCTSSFDQRQTGDLNVQIGLKNIQLIALLNGGKKEYVDYDYAYDYSEMTIKPQNDTTPKPLVSPQLQNNGTTSDIIQQSVNSTISQNLSNQPTTVHSNTTALTDNSAVSNNNGTLYSVPPNNGINQTMNILSVTSTHIPKNVADEQQTVLQDSPNKNNNLSATHKTSHCRRGFVQNHQGKCEYKGHGTTNALRRIVKLAQKIKIGRGYKET